MLAAALGIVLFVVISVALARFLLVENRERDEIVAVLEAQARGDVPAVLAGLTACDERCADSVVATSAKVRTDAEVLIARLDSRTAHSLFGTDEGWTRVVWTPGADGVPVVQCFRVRREGDPLTGRSVSLLRLGPPLRDNEGSC